MPVSKKINDKGSKMKDVKVVASSKVAKTSAVKEFDLSVPVYGLDGAKKGTVSLSKEVFGAKVNEKLMAQALRVYQVNQRQGTASSKTRSEVIGSTRKIYRQKGTGRARHGAIKAPIFVGGGVALGPKPRNFELKLSKQMKKKSLVSALSVKFSNDNVRIVDVKSATGKTSEIFGMLKTLSLIDKNGLGKVLFVSSSAEAKRAARNIEGVLIVPAASINTFVVLNSKNLAISKEAVEELSKMFEEKSN